MQKTHPRLDKYSFLSSHEDSVSKAWGGVNPSIDFDSHVHMKQNYIGHKRMHHFWKTLIPFFFFLSSWDWVYNSVCVHIKIPISIMAKSILTTSTQITKNTYLKPMQQMHQEEMYKYLKMISHSYQTIQILL